MIAIRVQSKNPLSLPTADAPEKKTCEHSKASRV